VRRIAMLVNPVFSAYRRRSIPRIQQIFDRAGIAVDLIETGPNRSASETVRRAVQDKLDNLDAVIVCGGDGTVFDVLQGLAGTTVPIGICPFGTGNILAQNLGLPRDPVAAAKALLTATPFSVPLGKITCGDDPHSWYFAMAAGVGGHAAMMRASHRYRKHRTGRLAYFAAGFEVMARRPIEPFELEITTVTGETFTRQASEMIAVRVSKLNLWRPGGGLELPFLRLASVEGTSRSQLLRAAVEALLLGAGQRHRAPRPQAAARYEDVLRIHAKPIPRMTYRGPIAVQADGEILDVFEPGGSGSAIIEMAGCNATFLRVPPKSA
jgi:diacylglycerol kinase (ATP)